MAADNLNRIAALIDRLDPLAGKTRGMRIEADEWNSLVDILRGVLQVDRAQEQAAQSQLEDRFAPKVHEHLGQVTAAWLDADLQARTGGAQGSVATRAALADMASKITSLGNEVGRLSALADAQGKLIDRSQVDELDRARKLKQFDDRFAGVENLRTLVATLSNDVGAVKGGVSTVLELRKSLSDASGNPIDVSGMREDLTALQGLRENLKGVDGDLLRMRDVELKLRELTDAVGIDAAGGLDARIGAAVSAAELRLNGKVDERAAGLQNVLDAGLATSENKLRAELTAGLDASRAAMEQSVTQQVAAAEGRLSTQFDAKLAQSAADSQAKMLAAATSLLDARFAQLPEQVRAVATSVVNDMRAGLRDELHAGLAADLNARFDALDTRLSTRADAVDARVASVQASIPGLVSGQLDAFGQELETRLDKSLDTALGKARDALREELIALVKSSVSENLSNLDARIAATVTAQLATLDARISQAVTAATKNLSQDIAAEVGRQMTAIDVAGQIKAANDALAQRLRGETTQAIADAQAKNSTAVNAATTLLRSEISALRTETSSAIDSRVNATGTALRKEFSTSIDTLKKSLKPDAFKVIVPTGIVHP